LWDEERLSGRPVAKGLVGPLGVEVVDVACDDASGFLDVLEAMQPGALLFEGADESLAEAILFGGVGRDVFLFQAVVPDQGSIGLRSKHQAVVMAED